MSDRINEETTFCDRFRFLMQHRMLFGHTPGNPSLLPEHDITNTARSLSRGHGDAIELHRLGLIGLMGLIIKMFFLSTS